MQDVGAEGDFDGVGAAVAAQLATGEVGSALLEVVDEGVERGRHVGIVYCWWWWWWWW